MSTTLTVLSSWRERGWLRRLDTAFARFLLELSPAAPDELVLAAALLVHMEGRGHSCLRLDHLLCDPQGVLEWPPEAASALRVVMDDLRGISAESTRTTGATGAESWVEEWVEAIASSPVVGVDDPNTESAVMDPGPPLILRGQTLYLRRYWENERRVAAQVGERSSMAVPVDLPAVRLWLDRLFPSPSDTGSVMAAPAGEQVIDWQKAACAIAMRSKLSILTGGP